MKKKNLKTILIAVLVAVVVICAIVFAILLRKDARGLTVFDRSKVVASAGGQSVTMGEYVMGLDNALSFYSQYYGMTYTEDTVRELQDTVVDQLLTQKLAVAKLDELGLTLSAEELASCKKAGEDQLKSLEESIGKQMATSGSFSNASLQTQINDYFTRQLGMSKAQYKKYIAEQEKAELAQEKLQAYYESETKDYTEDELLAYYDKYVQENYADAYSTGTYSMQMYMYQVGYSQTPYLYVPEGFLYIDALTYTGATEDDVKSVQKRLDDGDDFETLSQLAGVTTMHDALKAPYAIGEGDWGYALGSAEAYNLAKELEVGETGSVIVPTTSTDENGTETTSAYTLYIIRREEGSMCKDGAQFGIVDIDYYDGVRDTVKSAYESNAFHEITQSWMTNKQVSDTVYTYTGIAA